LIGGNDIDIELAANLRQRVGKFAHDAHRKLFKAAFFNRSGARPVAQFEPDLFQQRMQGRVERISDIKILAILAQFGWTQAHREQRAV